MPLERFHMLYMKPKQAKTLAFAWPERTQYKKTLDMVDQGCYIRYQGTLGILYPLKRRN